jgi:hypothetical protein
MLKEEFSKKSSLQASVVFQSTAINKQQRFAKQIQ